MCDRLEEAIRKGEAMTSETDRKKVNKPKALSAVTVGAPSALVAWHAIENVLEVFGVKEVPNEWQGVFTALFAGAMAAIAAYRTKDTAEDPTKFQKQRALRKARQEWVDNQIEREKQQ